MKLSFKALALVAAMISAPAFAADYATDLTVQPVDVAADATTALTTQYLSSGGLPTDAFVTNVALISQTTVDGNIAVIDQTGATTSYAAIIQAGSVGGIAYIAQTSNGNFAMIRQ